MHAGAGVDGARGVRDGGGAWCCRVVTWGLRVAVWVPGASCLTPPVCTAWCRVLVDPAHFFDLGGRPSHYKSLLR